MTRTPTVATLTGLVDLRDPQACAISPKAMAHHLAQINRYAGALELPLSVAQHSVLTLEIFRRRNPTLPGIYALLHDGHEYVWTDIIRPVQERIDEAFPGFRRWLQSEHGHMDRAIRERFGLPDPSIEICAAVHEADEIALATEWWALMPEAAGPCPVAARPMPNVKPKPLAWTAAADLFLSSLHFELAQASDAAMANLGESC
jgi:hypothetical protein